MDYIKKLAEERIKKAAARKLESDREFAAVWGGRKTSKVYEKQYRKQWSEYEGQLAIRNRQHAKSNVKFARKAELEHAAVEIRLKHIGYVSGDTACGLYERRCESKERLENGRGMFNAGKGVRTRKRCKVGSEISMRRPSAANSLSLNGGNAEFNSFRRGEKSHAKALMRRANEKQRMY